MWSKRWLLETLGLLVIVLALLTGCTYVVPPDLLSPVDEGALRTDAVDRAGTSVFAPVAARQHAAGRHPQ